MTTIPSKARLTDAMAAKFPFLPSGQKLVADDEQPGLYLKVGKGAKSWVVQTEVRVLDDKMKPDAAAKAWLKANPQVLDTLASPAQVHSPSAAAVALALPA